MRHTHRKIYIVGLCITLIALSVIPVYVDAQSAGEIAARIAAGTTLAPINAALIPIMTVVAGLLGFAGLILDFIINLTVVNLSKHINELESINKIWTVIRDLANMSFIFILLYEGIKMVLGLGGSGIKKVVTNIVIAAVLVNFSLLFTKVIIDASNIVTLGFYRSIVAAGAGSIPIGLGGVFMKVLRLSSIYNAGGALGAVFGGAGGSVVLIGNTLFMLVATFVFLAVAVMFVIRYLAFILLLVMSPFFFISTAIPGLNDLKDKYIKTLTSQALFAPAFMLLTWVTLTIAADDKFLNTALSTSFIDALTKPGPNTIGVLVDYILVIGLLIQSLITSKSIATKGGMVTSKYLDKGQAYIGGAIFGGASMAGRSTLGRWGQSVAEDKDLKERAARGDIGARLKLSAGNRLATASFDARNTSTIEAVTKQTGSFGKAINTKGYRGYVADKLKAQSEDDKKRAEQFKTPEDKESLAEYEQLLKDDPSIETNKQDIRKLELDALIKQEENQIKGKVNKIKPIIDSLTKGREDFEAKKTKAEKEIVELKRLILDTSNGLNDNSDLVAQYESQLRKKESDVITLTEGLTDVTNQLRERKLELNEINKDILALQLEAKEIENKTWISPEYEKIIADAGGRGDKGKDGKTQKAVTSTSAKNILAYADRVKNKTGLFSGLPNFRIDRDFSKKRAAAVRKLTKEEDDDAKMVKLIKKMAEDEKKKTEKDAQTNTTQNQTPPQPTTPPTSTP